MASRTSVFQPTPLGVAQVHPQQVAGEQRRLLAALARLDLEDDVLVVVGVARQQQQSAAAPRARPARLQLRRPRPRTTRPRRPARGPSPRSSPSSLPARGRSSTTGVSSAYRLPSARALAWSACTAGSASSLLELGVLGEQLGGGFEHGVLLSVRRWRRPGTTTAPVRQPREGLPTGAVRSLLGAGAACRSASRTGPRGRRCRGSSACRCRTGGTASRPRRGSRRSSRCCAS